MSNTYTQFSHTNFPDQLDDTGLHPMMTDVTQTLASAATNYANYVAAGNSSKARETLNNNPLLINCIFNADKFNWLRDSILAIETHYTRQIATMISEITSKAGTIKDDASSLTTSQKKAYTYSINKINQLLDTLSAKITQIVSNDAQKKSTTQTWSSSVIASLINSVETIRKNNLVNNTKVWKVHVPVPSSSAYPWTTTVNVTNMQADYAPIWGLDLSGYTNTTEVANRLKIQIQSIETGAGKITIKFSKKPAIAFELMGKGV